MNVYIGPFGWEKRQDPLRRTAGSAANFEYPKRTSLGQVRDRGPHRRGHGAVGDARSRRIAIGRLEARDIPIRKQEFRWGARSREHVSELQSASIEKQKFGARSRPVARLFGDRGMAARRHAGAP